MDMGSQQSPPEFMLPASFTPAKQEELFGEIVLTYDLIDDLLDAIQRKNNAYGSMELELITPFVTQATNSFNIISVFYTEVTRKGMPVTPEIRETMVSAYRNFYIALKELIDGMYDRFMPDKGSL